MKYIGFLCGGFSTKGEAHCLDDLWTKEMFPEEKLRECGNFYLPEFVRFNLDSGAAGFDTMSRFSMKVDRTVNMPVPVSIPELKLYLMPFNMALFAIRVEIESDDVNDITAAAATMRNLSKAASVAGFADAVFAPLRKTYQILTGKDDSTFSCSKLVENGNKLKLFQIALIDSDIDKVEDKDVLLFELGTVAPIGSYDEKSLYSASESYFDKLLSENKLSIFNNWSCLGLSDTLTILGENCPEWLVGNWIKDYFGMIYIWQLYRKNYLFRLTRNFRFDKRDPEMLIKESFEFEKKCSFNIISYNFLPEEFSRCVEHGLRIEEDKEVLYHLLEQENTAREKDSDTKMNYLLFFMTCLTMFSAIYDTCCLFDELFQYDNHMAGFRLMTSLMAFCILAAMLIYRVLAKKGR